MTHQLPLDPTPPNGAPTEYDCVHLALYAALLDADAAGITWQEAASTLMKLDPEHVESERCWRSHLERGRWIVGSGLADAVQSFGRAGA